MMNSWHVATAAEAIAAAQFARLGFDVSVQYGANQPEYDLIIADGPRMLKVSVKGSQDGSWGLTQTHLTKGKANYQEAADLWASKHKRKTAICLVQFKGATLDEMPRVYRAISADIASSLKAASGGRGDTILYENYRRGPRAAGAGNIERLPEDWRLSLSRVEQLLASDAT